MHRSRLSVICIDIDNDNRDAVESFWSRALRRSVRRGTRHPEYSQLGDVQGYGVLLQVIEEGESRVHLDMHTDDRAAEVARLEELGAVVVDDAAEWTVMKDPAGVIFCVVPVESEDDSLRDAEQWP